MQGKGGARVARRADIGRWLIVIAAAVVPLFVGQQVEAVTTQDLTAPGDLPNVSGLLDREVGENGPFRWSGERVEFQLQPLGWPLYATIHVQGVRPEGGPLARVGAEAYEQALGVQEFPRTPSVVEYRMPGASLLSINPRIAVTSTVFQPPGDSRFLGIVYYRLDQRSGPFPSLPSPWAAAWLILSVLLTYPAVRALLRALGVVGWNVPILSAVLLGMSVGILNAVERPWLVFYSLYFVVPPLVSLLLAPWIATLRSSDKRIKPSYSALRTPHYALMRPWPVACAVVAVALLVMAWHVVAPPEPPGDDPMQNARWGVSFYGALPLWVQVVGVIFVVGAVVWAWVEREGKGSGVRGQGSEDEQEEAETPSQSASSGATGSHIPHSTFHIRHWLQYAIPLAGMALFALLPVAYSEGDSNEFNSRIMEGAIWRERELLDFYVKVKLWRLLEPVFRLPSDIYQIVAVIAGSIYLAGANLVGRTIGHSRADGLVFVAALATIGNILIFFRYVESYALVTAASLFVLWACWRYAEGGLSFGAVGALATLAPLIHGSALWWGPMVVAAWLVRARLYPEERRWRSALTDLRDGVLVGAAIVLIVASIIIIDTYDFERFQQGLQEMGGRDGRTLLPLFTTVSPTEHYAFFSWSHLGAVIQEQLLTAPLALITVLAVIILAWRWVRYLATSRPALIVLAVGAVSMLFYSVTWNPDLGPRNDWDLLALAALPLTLLAVYLLLQLPAGRARRLALAAYLSVSGVHTAAWVLVHILGVRY